MDTSTDGDGAALSPPRVLGESGIAVRPATTSAATAAVAASVAVVAAVIMSWLLVAQVGHVHAPDLYRKSP